MKALLFSIGLATLLIMGGCNTSRLVGSGVYYDDIYYIPGVTKENVETALTPVPSISKAQAKAQQQELSRQARSYEKSDLARAERDDRDFSQIQERYASVLADTDQEEVDSLVYYNDETGYWVDGFDGGEMDRDYAERLIRFHGPFTRIPYWSPLYDQFVYFNDPDWNVYVDGNYAYAFPSWTNRWYDNYRFNSWHRPWGLSFGFGSSWGYPSYYGGYYNSFYGMYDPFYSSYYSPFYSPYYWNRPYHYGYHHGGYYGGNYHHNDQISRRSIQKGIKPAMGSNTRYSNSNTRNIQSLKGSQSGQSTSTISNQGTRVSRDVNGSTIISNGNTTYQRPVRRSSSLKSGVSSTSTGTTVTRYQGSGASTGTIQTQSRRGTTQRYSQPQQDVKPTYNRATYTRPSNSRVSSGTIQRNSNVLKSGSVNTSTPARTSTYNRGSSTNQRSSVSTRGYTPARSSSSSGSYNRSSSSSTYRSSGSSSSSSSSTYRSSGSSTRSSGSSSGSTVRQGRR